MLRPRVACALGLVATLAGLGRTAAQQEPASFTGRLLNRESGAPIAGATVLLVGTGGAARSDSAGTFQYRGLSPGDHRLEVRAVGYAMGVWIVSLAAGEQSREFALDVLRYELPEVVVEAHGSLAEFERRRAHGTGFFFTREEIEQRHARTLSDLARGVPGVQTTCGRGSCAIVMTRSPRGCRPEYYLDGFPASFSVGPDFQIMGVYGVEVYRTASEAPVEFRKPDLRCGVVLIWSDMSR